MAESLSTRRVLLFLTFAATAPATITYTSSDAPPPARTEAVRIALRRMPLRFEPDTPNAETFTARGANYAVAIDTMGARIALRSPSDDRTATISMRLVGRSRDASLTARRELPGISNYLNGNDRAQWRMGVRGYAELECRDAYPGVDLVYYGNQRTLEYDFHVAPGASPSTIAMEFRGANDIRIDADGNLVVASDAGELVQHAPRIYQMTNGSRQTIDGGYVIRNDGFVAFRVAEYDKRRPLVIDPVLTYSTYLGGANQERGNDVAVDAQGNAIVVGETYSSDFPTMNPWQPARRGFGDVFIAKFNPAGDMLVYATYLGGGSYDLARGVATDAAGNAYVVGQTSSYDFPTLNAAQSQLQGVSDAFVAKLDSTGALVYSTLVGGRNEDDGNGIAVDAFGRAHITGATFSADFPTTANALQPALTGNPAFRSTDGGATWTGLSAGLKTSQVRSFAFDHSVQPPIVYAGSEIEGVFRSTDGGTTWTRAANANLPPVPVYAIAFGQGAPAPLFAATHVGLFRSDDRGDSWSDLHLWPTVTSVVVLADSSIYAGLAWGSPEGVFRSTDGGQTWTDTGLPQHVNVLAASGSRVFAAVTTGIYRSDAGGPWIPVNSGITSEVAAIVVNPQDPNEAYAATVDGLLKTRTGGDSWSMIPVLSGQPIADVAMAASAPSTVYVSTYFQGIGVTHDSGDTWYPVGALNAQPLKIAVDPTAAATVYTSNSLTWDAFVTTLSADGASIDYSTYLGGSNVDLATGIAVDSDGARYIVGDTFSDDFPVVNAIQSAHNGLRDIFVAKLSPDGTALAYATYLGGFHTDFAGRIAVDASGRAYVTGITLSSSFPVFNAQQPSIGGGFSDVFVSALNSAGNAFIYSTFLGGNGWENDSSGSLGPDIAVSPSGEAYVTGVTMSTNFPVSGDAFQSSGPRGVADGFVTKYDATGAMQYSTLLGGTGADYPRAVAVDADGTAVVVGWTDSADMPMRHALQPAYAGSEDAFFAKVVPGAPTDTTGPAITITSPESRDYVHSDTLPLTYFATDDLSGVASGPSATLDGAATSASTIRLLSLPLGSHVLKVAASDNAGNTSARSVSFRVIATIDSLIAAVNFYSTQGAIKPATSNGLMAKLNAAKDAYARGKISAARGSLRDFVNQCTAAAGNGVSTDAANVLIADAQYVLGSF